jgi:hypothetical protein
MPSARANGSRLQQVSDAEDRERHGEQVLPGHEPHEVRGHQPEIAEAALGHGVAQAGEIVDAFDIEPGGHDGGGVARHPERPAEPEQAIAA